MISDLKIRDDVLRPKEYPSSLVRDFILVRGEPWFLLKKAPLYPKNLT